MQRRRSKAGAPGVDPGQLITESRLFPQRQTDVATGAPRCDREVNADRVLFGAEHRLRCSGSRGIEPTQGRGVRTTPASTRGHMWMGARTRTHELIGAKAPFFLGGCRAIPADGNRCPAPISGSEPSPPVWGPPRGLLRGWAGFVPLSPKPAHHRYQYEPGHACCALLEAGRPRAGRSRFA